MLFVHYQEMRSLLQKTLRKTTELLPNHVNRWRKLLVKKNLVATSWMNHSSLLMCLYCYHGFLIEETTINLALETDLLTEQMWRGCLSVIVTTVFGISYLAGILLSLAKQNMIHFSIRERGFMLLYANWFFLWPFCSFHTTNSVQSLKWNGCN